MEQNKRTLLAYQKRYKSPSRRDRREGVLPSDTFANRASLLMSAYNAWLSLAAWRSDIRRNERFVYADQFADMVHDYATCTNKTERQLLVEKGLQPSQYNIIRNILRTISGFWANNKTLPSCIAQKEENQAESDVLTATLHALYRKNELWKFDISQLIQLLISGLAISKDHFAKRGGGADVKNDFIDPFTFFVDNTMKDPRYSDCTLVGCYYDLPIDTIAGTFADGSMARERMIRELYRREVNDERIVQMVETFTDERVEADFFTVPVENFGLGRVIEIWRKETANCYWIHDYLEGRYYPDFTITEQELRAKLQSRMSEQAAMGVSEDDMLLLEWEYGTDEYWKYYYMTAWGDVLSEGVNPFWHEECPFTFELHEFYVGKIYPFVKDLIDANKQINRLSAMSELLSKFSAKSLMFIPTNAIANEEGYDIDYLQRAVTDYDTIIPYKVSKETPNAKPEFVNTMSQAFTPLNVVNMYLKLSEQISGVFGALQGQAPVAGTPAQSFLQQSQNSATSLVGVFEAINSFRMRRDKKNVQLMQQYYDEKRYIFDKDSGKRLLYDPDKVKNIDVEISISENTNTPAYRLMMNDVLMQLKQFDGSNMLDLRGLVEVGNWPFKDKLLDYLNGREQEMQQAVQQGQMPQMQGQLPPELAQEIGQYQFNPEVEQQLARLQQQEGE